MKDFLDGKQKVKNIMKGGDCQYGQFPDGVIATGATYNAIKRIEHVSNIIKKAGGFLA